MFGDKSKPAGPAPIRMTGNSGSLSIIGSEVTIHGNLTANGDVHLDGTVEGDLRCGSFILGASGLVKGNIAADKAQLAGAVDGTVAARELILDATARISGDLSYASLNMATGARVDGRISHREGTEEPVGGLKLVAMGE
jgi:cytoskeletal protein CcmA (bactofilin family)